MPEETRVTFRPGTVSFDGTDWSVLVSVARRNSDAGEDNVELVLDGGETALWISSLKHGLDYAATIRRDGGRERLLAVHPRAVRAVSRSPAPDLTEAARPFENGGIAETAIAVRSMLEQDIWPDWLRAIGDDPHPPGACASVGMCRISASCLLPILQAEHPDWTWKRAGGHPSVAYVARDPREARRFLSSREGLDGGMWDRVRGQWDGHYWLVGSRDGETVIVDPTSDQYGWEPVTVADGDDPRYRANYTARELRQDFSGPKARAFGEKAALLWEERSRAAVKPRL